MEIWSTQYAFYWILHCSKAQLFLEASSTVRPQGSLNIVNSILPREVLTVFEHSPRLPNGRYGTTWENSAHQTVSPCQSQTVPLTATPSPYSYYSYSFSALLLVTLPTINLNHRCLLHFLSSFSTWKRDSKMLQSARLANS